MSAQSSHDPDARHLMNSYLQRIATGPEMSKDLSLEEARTGMQLILDGKVHPVQAAVFLIALRMKRESDDENRGILDAIRQSTQFAIADVSDLVDVADPYDGFLRHLPASPFLPAVLAACGIPGVSHGVESVGPKYGVTHHQILSAAGIDVGISPSQAAHRIADPDIAWAYVDQRQYNPALYSLVELRNLIIKRPCITTIEVMAGPVRAAGHTHLVNGYVHNGYKRIYIDLARHAGYYSALIVRGIEGGVIPLLNREGNGVSYYAADDDHKFALDPSEIGLISELKAVPLPDRDNNDAEERNGTQHILAKKAAQQGLKALQGHQGLTRDSLVYATSSQLVHLRRFSNMKSASRQVCTVLDNGKALAHFQS